MQERYQVPERKKPLKFDRWRLAKSASAGALAGGVYGAIVAGPIGTFVGIPAGAIVSMGLEAGAQVFDRQP